MSQILTEQQAEALLLETRWPNGILCPRCGSGRPNTLSQGGRRRRWRCCDCGYVFSVLSMTPMHDSKASLMDWVSMAIEDNYQCQNASTHRKIANIVECTGHAPCLNRLKVLCSSRPLQHTHSPLLGISTAQRNILAILRTRVSGLSTTKIVKVSGLSESHTKRSLRALSQEGFAKYEETTIMWGYSALKINVWKLQMTPQVISALPLLAYKPIKDCESKYALPPEFWSLFWSGICASKLTSSDRDKKHVALTLLDDVNPSARSWALIHTPLEILEEVSEMRGYDQGIVGDVIRSTLKIRSTQPNAFAVT